MSKSNGRASFPAFKGEASHGRTGEALDPLNEGGLIEVDQPSADRSHHGRLNDLNGRYGLPLAM